MATLEGRRNLSRLAMFHQVVYGSIDIEKDIYLTPLSRTLRNGNSKLFLRPHSNCNQHANSFFPWSIKHWNKLPGSIVDIEDKFKFKTAVCDHLVELGEWF